MPALEAERRPESLAPESAQPQTETPETTFTADDDLRAVIGPGAATGRSASELAFGDVRDLDHGMYDVYEYRDACVAAGKPEKWQDYYHPGHTEAKGFVQPYEQRATLKWNLKQGQSASQALQDFIAGPTLADYRVIGVARELDELRDELGERQFDQLFGSKDMSEDAAVPKDHRLEISSDMYTTPFVDRMRTIAADYDARPTQRDLLPPPVQEQRDDGVAKQTTLAEEPVIVAEDLGKRPGRGLM